MTNGGQYLKEHSNSLPAKEYFPISVDYIPEIDVYNELGSQEAAHY